MSLTSTPVLGNLVEVEERLQKLWTEWLNLYFTGSYTPAGASRMLPECLIAFDDLQPKEMLTSPLPSIRLVILDAKDSNHWGETWIANTSGTAGTAGTGRLLCRHHMASFQISQRYQGSDDEGRISHTVRRIASGLHFLLTHRAEPRSQLLEKGLSNLCASGPQAQSGMNVVMRTIALNFDAWLER